MSFYGCPPHAMTAECMLLLSWSDVPLPPVAISSSSRRHLNFREDGCVRNQASASIYHRIACSTQHIASYCRPFSTFATELSCPRSTARLHHSSQTHNSDTHQHHGRHGSKHAPRRALQRRESFETHDIRTYAVRHACRDGVSCRSFVSVEQRVRRRSYTGRARPTRTQPSSSRSPRRATRAYAPRAYATQASPRTRPP